MKAEDTGNNSSNSPTISEKKLVQEDGLGWDNVFEGLARNILIYGSEGIDKSPQKLHQEAPHFLLPILTNPDVQPPFDCAQSILDDSECVPSVTYEQSSTPPRLHLQSDDSIPKETFMLSEDFVRDFKTQNWHRKNKRVPVCSSLGGESGIDPTQFNGKAAGGGGTTFLERISQFRAALEDIRELLPPTKEYSILPSTTPYVPSCLGAPFNDLEVAAHPSVDAHNMSALSQTNSNVGVPINQRLNDCESTIRKIESIIEIIRVMTQGRRVPNESEVSAIVPTSHAIDNVVADDFIVREPKVVVGNVENSTSSSDNSIGGGRSNGESGTAIYTDSLNCGSGTRGIKIERSDEFILQANDLKRRCALKRFERAFASLAESVDNIEPHV